MTSFNVQSFTRSAGLRSELGLNPTGMGIWGTAWTCVVAALADEMGFNWYLKYGFNGTGGAGAAFINQPLESADSKKLRGKPVCFSFYAKTSSHHAGKRFRSCIGFHTETGVQDDGMYYSGFKNASSTTGAKKSVVKMTQSTLNFFF